MGVDLFGRDGGLHFNWQAWRWLLATAHDHGWEPAGTVLDDYVVAQRMGLSDAPESWGEADATRIREAVEGWNPIEYLSNDGQWVSDEDACGMTGALDRAVAAGAESPLIQEFIGLCRGGGFRIW